MDRSEIAGTSNSASYIKTKVVRTFWELPTESSTNWNDSKFTDNQLEFRSNSIQKISGSDLYQIKGQVTSNTKAFPAKFKISANQLGGEFSRFATSVESEDLAKYTGMSGKAKGNFDLIFRTKNSINNKAACGL